jgi:hypothetical protein
VSSALTQSEEVQVFLGSPGIGGAGVTGADGRDGVAAEIYDFDLGEIRTFRERTESADEESKEDE